MRPWTHTEEESLRYLASRLGGPELAVAFDRTHAAIRCKAHELGVNLTGTGRTALELTEGPGGTDLTPAVARRVGEIINAKLCQYCGRRPSGIFITVEGDQGLERVSLCGPCYDAVLREVREEESDMAAKRRKRRAMIYRRRLRAKEGSLGAPVKEERR